MTRWIQANRGFLVFLLCFGIFRTAVADWNPIPSGSMRPTLLEGDVVLVNRLAYDVKIPLTHVSLARLAVPQRGEVVTFDSPQDGVRTIKRIVGLPGDVVALRNNRLFVNGRPAGYADLTETTEPLQAASVPALRGTERLEGAPAHAVQFLAVEAPQRHFGPVVVPPDHYFVQGDNRDNSADSRFFGPVPHRLLIGRAHHLLVSADLLGGFALRLQRFGQAIE